MSSASTTGPATAPEGAFDHGAVSRFNAWFFTAFDRYIDYISRPHKSAAFDDLAPGRVLEIGAGVGANLRYLPVGTELVAVEPNLAMLERLRARCAAAGIPVTVLAGGAERIPLPDDSVDEVICSLVLCTVGDPERVLAEVQRVLKPGGRFRFVEHVESPRSGPRRFVQHLIRRPWAWLFEGCHLHRHTPQLVDAAGFSDVQVVHRKLRRSLFFPVNSAVWGIAHV